MNYEADIQDGLCGNAISSRIVWRVSIPCDSPAVILWDSSRAIRRDGYLLRKSDKEQGLCTVWFTTVPVLMRSYGWRAETPALLGRRAYLHANGCGLLSCSSRLIAQLPAWDSQERAAGNCRMDSLQDRRWYAGLCLPGRSAAVKEGDQNSGATVSLSDRRPHRGNFQIEAPPSVSLQAFSWASRREGRYPWAFRALGATTPWRMWGNITCPQSCLFLVPVCDFSWVFLNLKNRKSPLSSRLCGLSWISVNYDVAERDEWQLL